jgi:hypothetical protein
MLLRTHGRLNILMIHPSEGPYRLYVSLRTEMGFCGIRGLTEEYQFGFFQGHTPITRRVLQGPDDMLKV